MNNFDPNEEIIDDIEAYLKMPLEDKTPPKWGSNCHHFKVHLDAENRKVICQNCKKELDPFWYLELLADEWHKRRYRDAEAVMAYRELKQQRLDAMARGKHYIRPEKGDGQKCWDTYEVLHGEPPEYVYYRGGWYAGKKGHAELFDYMKMVLARRENDK